MSLDGVKNCRLFAGFPSPFRWSDYLEATGSLAVPDECFSKVSIICRRVSFLNVSLFAHRLRAILKWCHFCFYDIVVDCIQIFLIHSLLHSEIKHRRWWNKHMASIWLLI